MTRWVALAALVSTGALAENVGQPWGVVTARTLAPGANLLVGEVGFPAVSVSYLHGLRSGLNLGGRVGFAWGVEGLLGSVVPGARAQFLLKLRFVDDERVSFGMTFEPGFLAYSSYVQGPRYGLVLPLGFKLGIAASSALAVGINVDFPLWIEFGNFGGVNVPILTGAGVEYFLTSQLALFAKVQVGPTIRSYRPAELTLVASLGVAWRL